MSRFQYENHRGSPTLTLLNVLSVLGMLNVLNVLYVLNALNVLNMPMDVSLACWALFTMGMSIQQIWQRIIVEQRKKTIAKRNFIS